MNKIQRYINKNYDHDDDTNNKGRYEGDEGCRKLPPVEHCTEAENDYDDYDYYDLFVMIYFLLS